VVALEIEKDDVIVLCCDGLSNLVTDSEILEIAAGTRLAEAPERLIALANERGGDDNITVIVVKVGG
jgi:protein phosphatase